MKTTRTSLFLMANLGPEVARVLSAKEKNKADLLGSAVDRARNIIAELKKLPDTKNNTEIDILDDVVNDLGKKNSIYEISSEEFTSYFLPFAMRLTRV